MVRFFYTSISDKQFQWIMTLSFISVSIIIIIMIMIIIIIIIIIIYNQNNFMLLNRFVWY